MDFVHEDRYLGMSIVDIARLEFEAREAERLREEQVLIEVADLKKSALARVREIESHIEKAGYVLCFVLFVLAITSSWMAENWFSYQKTFWDEKEVPYEYVVDRVDTYVAYTTTYGECYHAKSCGYLHSSYKTTVYQAKNDGYRGCSRCTPREKITLEITETRYKTERCLVTETIEPAGRVFFISAGVAYAIYFCTTRPLKKKLEDARSAALYFTELHAYFML